MPKIPFGLATGNRLNRLSDEVFQGFLDVSLTFFWSQFILKRWGTTRVGGLVVSLLVKQVFSIRKRQLPKKPLPGAEAGTRQVAEAETGGTRGAEVNLLLGNSLNFSLFAGSNQRKGWECLRHLFSRCFWPRWCKTSFSNQKHRFLKSMFCEWIWGGGAAPSPSTPFQPGSGWMLKFLFQGIKFFFQGLVGVKPFVFQGL